MLLWAKRPTRPPNNFFADTATVNANGYETLLASGLSTFFIKGNPVFSNGSKILLKYPPECSILCDFSFG